MTNPNREQQMRKLGLPFVIPDAAFQVQLSEREVGVILMHALARLLPYSSRPKADGIDVTDEVKVLRQDQAPAYVRIYNHGPHPVTVCYGDVDAIADQFGAVLNPGDADESPVQVCGKITAVCATGKDAAVTLTRF